MKYFSFWIHLFGLYYFALGAKNIWPDVPCNSQTLPHNCDFNKIPLLSVKDFERCAPARLPLYARNYYLGRAPNSLTYNENIEAFDRIHIRPKMLRDVSHSSLEITTLEQKIAFPIGVSPTAIQNLADPEAENATAAAATSLNTIMILSSLSHLKLEEVAAHVRGSSGTLWMQLYFFQNRSITENIVRRAERSGFRAIVVTCDTPFLAPLTCNANKDENISNTKLGTVGSTFRGISSISPITFKDISWLKSITWLPIVAKGIVIGEDAQRVIAAGASAILVSNHGGRQLDGDRGTIDSLPEVVEAVSMLAPRPDVYLDGGIRTGVDVFKALARGAKAVFIGRPALWGLTIGGEAGVRKVLTILKEEFNRTMILAGASNPNDIRRDSIVPAFPTIGCH